MKKLLSLAIVLLLTFGTVAGVFAAADVTSTGVIVNFTENTVKLNVNDEVKDYQIPSTAKVVRMEEEVSFADVAKKGLQVNFTAQGNQISFIDVPDIGNAMSGTIEGITRTGNDIIVEIKEARVANSDDEGSLRDKDAVVTGEVEDTAVFVNNTRYQLGAVAIVPGTVKVTVSGKELKVIASTAKFDPAVDNDEAQLVTKAGNGGSTITEVVFEKAFGDASITAADADKLVQVTFKKKEFTITKIEITKLKLNQDAIVELNGRPSTLAKVISRATEAFVQCNLAGEIVHIDAYYSNVNARLDSIKDNVIYFTVKSGNTVLYKDKVEALDYMSVQNAVGTELELTDFKAGDFINFTVDPADGYKAVSLTRLFY